jgi:hypothetical protein
MSKISFEDFVTQFKNELNIQTLDFENIDLNDIPEYDSMGKISASLLIEGVFGFQIDFKFLDSEKSLLSLWQFCTQKSIERHQ